ncbi:MAG: T9SS type A sorting domain-containing protein [Flavobacteriales bacterium]
MATSVARGQATLGMSSTNNIPDSVFVNDSGLYVTYVQNTDCMNVFNGSITVYLNVYKNSTFYLEDSVILPTTTLNPGDTTAAVLNILFDTLGNFSTGINTVVIWPSAANTMITDSLWKDIVITLPMGIVEGLSTTDRTFFVYPNPTYGPLNLQTSLEPADIERVSLFDQSGRMLRNNKGKLPCDISDLPAGVYLLELKKRDGKTYRVKIMRE